MENNEQKTKPTLSNDKGDYTHHHKRFYWSRKTHSIQPFEVLVSEVMA